MTLSEAYRCARSLEAIENYALADAPLGRDVGQPIPKEAPDLVCLKDNEFWTQVFQAPGSLFGKTFLLGQAALSEWIARVPGLYWSEGARALRDLASNAVEYKSQEWTTYHPQGKSQIVLGGIGTLRFPPDESGRRLVTLSCGHNASSGVPALVSSDVWQQHRLAEGSLIDVCARWQPMSVGWAERFPSIKSIPRGYLILEEPNAVLHVHASGQPTQFHPCTVMMYTSGDAILYDFVYATADTRVPRYRAQVADFFAAYKDRNDRNGRYLLSADIGEPLWDADYDSPAALRRAEAGSQAQLELLQARVRNDSFRGRTLNAIAQPLSHYYDNDSLKRLSSYIGIPTTHWFTGAASASSAVELLNLCVSRGKVEELLDAMVRDYPNLFQAGG